MSHGALPDGLAFEETIDGTSIIVGVDSTHPVDLIEPDPERATGTFAAALRYFSGHDQRTLQEIADAEGYTKQRLSVLVCQIADRLGVSTAAPGRRRPKKKTAVASEPATAGVNEVGTQPTLFRSMSTMEGADNE